MELIVLFIFAGVLGIIPAMIASKKGRHAGAWWIYGKLLFIIALPHALLLEPSEEFKQQRAEASGMRKCPFCAEMVKAEARICRYCNRDLSSFQALDHTASSDTHTAPLDSLVEQLSSADPKVKDQAIIALGNRGDASRKALPALMALLRDLNPDVRDRAKWAIWAIERV